MKLKLSRDWFDICILFISVLGIYAGLSDLDYVWQADLGRQILQEGNFNGCYNQIWGSLGVAEYYDHEWLCNIIFYLFSLIPYKPLIWLKLFICLLSGLTFIYFSKEFELNNLSNFKKYQMLLVIAIYSLVFCKIKAYSFSVAFLMIELILLNKYRKNEDNKLLIWLCILCIVWTNIHSGSMPLFFVVAGIYWLVSYRNKKLIGVGCLILLSTCINPYGYKLLVFNFIHNFDSTMKVIIKDWISLDAKTSIGLCCTLFILWSIVLIANTKSINKPILYLSICVLYLTFGSVRHFIYFVPLLLLIIKDSDLDLTLKFDNTYLVLFSLGLSILVCFSTFTGDYDSYSYNYVDSELEKLIYEIEDSEGTFNDHSFVDLVRYGKQDFITGGYPLHSQRVVDTYTIINNAGVADVEKIIDYYKLDKFIFNKYNLLNFEKTGYLITNTLYNYLIDNEDYELLYDSEELVYFRKKESNLD